VIPDEFTGYFTAASTAAGAVIGLPAIAISVRPEGVLAAEGPPAARAIAASAFTALVNSFFVSLIPGDLVVARGSMFSATRTPRARSAPEHDRLPIASWWPRRL
jgi:hypothetical protein